MSKGSEMNRMPEIIYVSDYTGKIVGKGYPNAVAYQRVHESNINIDSCREKSNINIEKEDEK